VKTVNKILHICFSCCAASSDGPENRKNPGVLYGDGRYYKKDRTDKVSFVGNSKKSGKAADKPILSIKPDIERSATGKPNIVPPTSEWAV
jgi:hypothetical protein